MENQLVEKKILNDYTEKIKNKIPQSSNLYYNDINELIAILNYCFQKKNDFFIINFNKKVIKDIYICYNQIKTNILTPEIKDIFGLIEHGNLKVLRFVLINFVNNYQTIMDNPDNSEICGLISKESMKRCLQFLNNILK